MAKLNPPFRAEHIGSFVRPESLLNVARKFRTGEVDSAALAKAADDAVTDIVRFQESVGMPSITDGEFRRRAWSVGFIDNVEGFGLREGALEFKTSTGATKAELSPYAKERLKRTRGITTHEFSFLKSVVRKGLPKVTIPAPSVMHFFLGARAVDEAVYPDIETYFDDLVKIYQEEIAELAKMGCTYIQLDDTAMACLCDETVREKVKRRGDDPNELLARYVKLINDVLRGRPADMTVGLHLCRGNLKGTWMAEGSYDFIAEKLFGGSDVDAFFLEYDSPRAGDFNPLKHMAKDKTVVLGLISSKGPQLESKDDIKRRIHEAAKFVDLDRLCLSPQCGFSSVGGGGQIVDLDDERRKLELVLQIAQDVWG